MKNWFSKLPEGTERRKRNAYRITAILLVVLVLFDVFSTINYFGRQVPQQLLAMILAYVATVATLGCAWLLRQDRVNAAVWGLILINLLSLLVSPLAGSGLGVIYGVTAILFTAVIAGQGLESQQIMRANALGVLTGISIYLLDISLPNTLVSVTTDVTLFILFGLLLALGFVIARQFRDYTIRSKLIILFLTVSIIPLSVFTFLNYLNNRTALINNADHILAASAEITAKQLDDYFTQNLNSVRAEAQFPDVVDYLILASSTRAGSETEAHAQKFVNTLAREDPVYTISISIIDMRGRVLVDNDALSVGANRSGAEYFIKAMQTGLPYATGVLFDQQTGRPSIYFATTVRDADGKIVGILSKQYNASILQAAITQNIGLAGDSSFSVLLDQNHIRLADGSDQSSIYKTITPLDPKTIADLQSKQLLPPGTRDELSTNLPDFEKNLGRVNDQPFFVAELHSSNLDMEQVATAKMTTQPWVVVFAQSQKVFIEPINVQTRSNILITILISLLVVGFGFFVSQTVAGPIVRLTKTAEAVSQGDLFISAPVETKDEIGKLASSFNTMTTLLRDLINSLEQRIADRTAVAEKAQAEAETSAAAAQAARKDLEAQIWLATGQTHLADVIRGEQSISKLSENIITQVTQYLGAQAGALYLLEKETLNLTGSYAFVARPGFSGKFQLGEGMVGQAAADKRAMLITRPQNAAVISTGLADFVPRQVLVAPFEENGQVAGVLELAALTEFTQPQIDFLSHVSESIGIAFRTVQARQHLADALLETQQQAEELQAQEEELRAANEELLSQAESLKAARQNSLQKEQA